MLEWWLWYVCAGIWFPNVLGSRDYNKPKQTLAGLLQNECKFSQSEKNKTKQKTYSFSFPD